MMTQVGISPITPFRCLIAEIPLKWLFLMLIVLESRNRMFSNATRGWNPRFPKKKRTRCGPRNSRLLIQPHPINFMSNKSNPLPKVAAATVLSAIANHRLLATGPYASWKNVFLGREENLPVSGFVQPGFEKVFEAFKANFTSGQEIGAQFSAYVNGKLVVDLVGGHTSPKRDKELTTENFTVIFSSGKCVTGIIISYLVDKGLLNFNMKIADVWPEFAQGNKENVTLKDLVRLFSLRVLTRTS
jgi:hypothetical protein